MANGQVKTLYFDESNYTGYNLLDADQPVFVITSSDIGDEEAEEILRGSFPGYKGGEFKAGRIWKDREKRPLAKFGESISGFNGRIFSYAIDKRFAVLTKAIDFLIEPQVYYSGYDWYKNGYCWRFANMTHFALSEFAPPGLYESIVRTYQAFSRSPTENSLKVMQHALRLMANSVNGEIQSVMEQFALGAEMFHEFHDLETFHGSDELQVTTMVSLVAAWRQKFTEDFVVVHDNTANFYRRRALWEKIVGPDAPAQLHPLGDGTFVQYPLRVIRTEGVDSKTSSAVQLCDIVAGLAAKVQNPNRTDEDDRYLQPMIDAGFNKLNFNGIYFRPEFPDGPPERRNGPDAVDLMMAVMFPKGG